MPFCANCGTPVQSSDNFCVTCGRALFGEIPAAPAQSSLGTLPRTLEYRISPGRILLMTVLSYGLYLFYWFYLTWKQYRDYTGNRAYPVWHAMAIGIPIYNLFRTHAHMRSFRELMLNAGVPSTIREGWAVLVVLVSSAVSIGSLQLPGEFGNSGDTSQGSAIVTVLSAVISIGIVTFLLRHVQGNLNRYWDSLENMKVVDARIGPSEVILGVIGAISWLVTLANLFNAA